MGSRNRNRWIQVGMVAMVVAAAWTASLAGQCTFTEKGTVWLLDEDCEAKSTIWVPQGYTLDGRGHRITAVEGFPGGWVGAIVQNEGPLAHVRNTVISTDALECICQEGPDRLDAIRFDGASGSITDNLIVSPNKGDDCGCQEGMGISIRNPPFDGSGGGGGGATHVVEVLRNVVRDYGKGGIFVAGDVEALVRRNLIRGAGRTEAVGQNGIQVGFGAAAELTNNTVTGNWFEGGAEATGVLIFESDDVMVQRNDLLNNQTSIATEAWCWYRPSADRNTILGNFIDQTRTGISVASLALDEPFSNCSPSANDNRIVDNMVTTSRGRVALTVVSRTDCEDCDWQPEAKDPRIRDNWTKGFDFDLILFEDGAPLNKKGKALVIPYLP